MTYREFAEYLAVRMGLDNPARGVMAAEAAMPDIDWDEQKTLDGWKSWDAANRAAARQRDRFRHRVMT